MLSNALIKEKEMEEIMYKLFKSEIWLQSKVVFHLF